jgi:predicted ATP-grasp superfamily ATP-dependent carboligase
MQQFMLSTGRSLYKFLMLTFLVGIMTFSGSFVLGVQSAAADVSSPKQALKEILKDQSSESPLQAYEEKERVVENPKVGIEKEYERNEQKYFQDHPDQAGIVEQAKELVTKLTEPEQQ